MNNIKHFLLNKKWGIIMTSMIMVLFIAGCDADHEMGAAIPKAEWTLLSKEKNESFSTTYENNLLYAYDFNVTHNKLSIKFGAKPTSSAMLKVVDYFKTPLASDEMIIGIKEGDFYYLSTGTDNISISPQITYNTTTNSIENITIKFNNVRVGRHDLNFNPLDVTTVTGFISQK